jgi:hypothetical protein
MGLLPDKCILVTLDVSSLYTNIPHKEGLEATKEALNKSRPGEVNPSNESLVNLMEFVLTKNNFQFDDDFYLQICGTAMGSRAAPSFANVYLDKFERQFVYTYKFQPLIWLRYLDDCFCIWQHGETELNKFYEHLNSCNTNIKFTMETSREEIPFLDIKVKLNNKRLETDLYCKPTDSHSYLHYSSAHPKACRDSIPYSQFLRIRKICTKLEDFDRHAIEFAKHFRRRNYPNDLLERAVIKARRLDRDDLLKTKKPKDEGLERPILVNTYHPNDNTMKNIVTENWGILGKSNTTSFLYKNKPLIAYRRPKNLRDMLVKADIRLKKPKPQKIQTADFLKSSNVLVPQMLKQTSITSFLKPISNTEKTEYTDLKKEQFHRRTCTNIKCKFCPFLDKSGEITCHSTKEIFPAKFNVTCQSSNLIYCITCKKCGQHYVGQTKRKLHCRLQEHLRSITKGKRESTQVQVSPQPVGIHFSQSDHDGIKDLKIQILDFVNFHPDSKRAQETRLKVEKKWIHTLRSPAPNGMNIFD